MRINKDKTTVLKTERRNRAKGLLLYTGIHKKICNLQNNIEKRLN